MGRGQPRVDLRRVGKRALESMARVGVFDEWGSRACILDALDRMMGHSGSTHDAAEAGQMSLTIGKNVRRLWQEKLDLQETAEGLGVGIPPEPKRQVKNTREEEEK